MLVAGRLLLDVSCVVLAVGRWLLVVGGGLLGCCVWVCVGCRLLDVGC